MLLLLSLSLCHCSAMVGGWGLGAGTLHDRASCSQIQCRTDRWIDRVVNYDWTEGGMDGWIPQGPCVRTPLTGAVSVGCNAASLTNTLTWSQTQQLPGAQFNCLLAARAELRSRGVTECVNMYVRETERTGKSGGDKWIC